MDRNFFHLGALMLSMYLSLWLFTIFLEVRMLLWWLAPEVPFPGIPLVYHLIHNYFEVNMSLLLLIPCLAKHAKNERHFQS